MEKSNNQCVVKLENFILHVGSDKTIDYGTISIPYGETVITEGPNGSGKSTLFNVIAGRGGDYCVIESGNMSVFGKDILEYDSNELRRKVVYIDQHEEFLSHESPYRFLIRSASIAISDLDNSDMLKTKIRDLAFEYYSKYLYKFFDEGKRHGNVEYYRNNPQKDLQFMYLKNSYKLSGGQRKMLHIISGIIKARVAGCSLVLMDEPINNLDKENKKNLISIINELRKDFPQITILLITHCRVFPGIRSAITLQVLDENNKVVKCSYQIFDDNLPIYNCLSN